MSGLFVAAAGAVLLLALINLGAILAVLLDQQAKVRGSPL
jgi:hypothetical protein